MWSKPSVAEVAVWAWRNWSLSNSYTDHSFTLSVLAQYTCLTPANSNRIKLTVIKLELKYSSIVKPSAKRFSSCCCCNYYYYHLFVLICCFFFPRKRLVTVVLRVLKTEIIDMSEFVFLVMFCRVSRSSLKCLSPFSMSILTDHLIPWISGLKMSERTSFTCAWESSWRLMAFTRT